MSSTQQIWDSMDVENKTTNLVHPLHEVRDEDKLEALAENLETQGWVGRPVAVLDIGHLQAITGSHRLAAAEVAGLDEVPIVVEDAAHIDADELDDFWGLDDEGKGCWLRDHGFSWAADLLDLEAKNNG